MIDIHEYVKYYRYSHPSFQGVNESIISKFIEVNSDISHIIEVCTTEVFPQCIKLNNKEFLIWDYAFWMLYKRFLLGVWRFSPEKTSVEDLSDFLRSLLYLFLSLRFAKLPAFSYYFAKEHNRLNKLIRSFQWISNTEEEKKVFGVQLFKQIDDFSQWQVFFHELRHYTYRQSTDSYLRDSVELRSIFKLYDSTLRSLPDYDKLNYDHFWDTYSYYADVENINVLEEMCCDVFAIVDFYEMYLKNVEQSKEEALMAYFSTIRYVLEFQRILTIA